MIFFQWTFVKKGKYDKLISNLIIFPCLRVNIYFLTTDPMGFSVGKKVLMFGFQKLFTLFPDL